MILKDSLMAMGIVSEKPILGDRLIDPLFRRCHQWKLDETLSKN